ncbi:MAG: response regulator [Candidatus Methanomethylicus sp.]|nr:response regulator [Candidatus Methanomethylicus sp.]
MEYGATADQKRSVLIIDDDQFILYAFSRLFQSRGFEAETAMNGNEALEKIDKRVFDVVLIDVRLPDMNGMKILTKMNCNSSKSIKVILTGDPSEEGRERAIEMGADAYIAKPLRAEELFAFIDQKFTTRL